jgi:hypothetical protein
MNQFMLPLKGVDIVLVLLKHYANQQVVNCNYFNFNVQFVLTILCE